VPTCTCHSGRYQS